MNFLSHLAVASLTHTQTTANLIADYYKGPVPEELPDSIRHGIYMHRFVDSFAHQNPLIHKSLKLFPPKYRQVSPIWVDLMIDHFLHKHWSDLLPDWNLNDFILMHYQNLEKEKSMFPSDIQDFIEIFLREKWMEQYGTMDGIIQIAHRLSRRRRFLNSLKPLSNEIHSFYHEMETISLYFLPDLFMNCLLFKNRLRFL